jgi:hypothetical protein
MGKTKLDKDGYIIPASWEGGCLFPRPSGAFTAQQIYYNYEKKFGMFDMGAKNSGESFGIDRNLNIDKYGQFDSKYIKQDFGIEELIKKGK